MSTKLYSYQKEGIRLIEKFNGRVLLADEMGLGKTIQALFYLKHHPESRPAIIVCPASVKYVWAEQAKEHCGLRATTCQGQRPPRTKEILQPNSIFVINYDILIYWANYLRRLRPKIVILDECFPYETPVLTDSGWIPIGRIVEEQIPVTIASYNFSCNAVDFQPIRRYIKKFRTSRIVELSWKNGSVRCTKNHKIWVEGKGYIHAKNVCKGDAVRVVRETCQETQPILQQILFGKMEGKAARNTTHVSRPEKVAEHNKSSLEISKDREGKTTCQGIQYQNETAQSFPVKGSNSQRTGYEGEERNASYLERQARGQRDLYQTTTEALEIFRPWMETGDVCQNPSGVSLPAQLQSRHRQPTIKGRGGDRRSRTPYQKSKSPGQKEGYVTEVVRVDCVTIYKRNGSETSEMGPRSDSFVYNLEVEEHHNYFANGLLVSNCHFIKSRGIARTRAVRKLCAPIRKVSIENLVAEKVLNPRNLQEDDWVSFLDKDGETIQGIVSSVKDDVAVIKTQIPHLMGLSGTPLTNRPEELWSTLNLIWPDYFPAFTPYAWEFCQPVMTPYGRWEYKGATHLDVLHKRLKRLGMIRRLKRDVLKDLPTKQRIVIPLDIDNRQEYDKALKDFINWLTVRDAAKAHKARHAERLVQMAYLRRLAAEGKLKAVADWIDNFLEEADDKLVVGCLHHTVINKLHEQYKGTSLRFTGKTSQKARHLAITEFRKNPKRRIILGQIKAIGTGVDGLQDTASTSAVIEFPWDPGTVSQFDDRIHRIGQKRKVTIYYLVGANTIEEKLCRILQDKQDILTRTLDGEQDLERMKLDIYDQLERELLKGAKR